MFACRPLLWLFSLAAIAASDAACCAQSSTWQPYRVVATPHQLAPLQPAQYLISEPVVTTPVDAVTDFQLNQLSSDCCPDTPVYTEPYLDPVIASASHRSKLEFLPSDVIWHSYWAGAKEPRTSAIAFEEFSNDVSLLDVSLGGRTALLRNASRTTQGLWRGWELQIEGAAQLRLNLDQDWDFDSADFRFGVPLILAREQLLWKLAYYHLSSHVGDEFLVRNPTFTRINFSRDVLVGGLSYFPLPAVRLYGETGYAFYDDEGSDPWEFQFGVDIARPGPTGTQGTPFAALNGHLREEVHFGGNFVVQAGWLWRGNTGRVLRTGLHYYNGKSPQFEFFDTFEQQLGFGIWQEY